MEQIKCPRCNGGNVAVTLKGNITKAAASFGGGFVEGATKAVADGVYEGLGRFVPKFGSSLAALVRIEYVCHTCDCLFKTLVTADGQLKEIAVKKEPMPDAIIEKVRDNYIGTLKQQRPYTSMVIFSLLTLYCLVYFFIGAAEGNGLRIVFSLICAIPLLIPAVLKGKKIGRINQEIEGCEYQSLLEFKHDHRDLFSQYSQYN